MGHTIPENNVIHGCSGSDAEKYAEKWYLKFEQTDD